MQQDCYTANRLKIQVSVQIMTQFVAEDNFRFFLCILLKRLNHGKPVIVSNPYASTETLLHKDALSPTPNPARHSRTICPDTKQCRQMAQDMQIISPWSENAEIRHLFQFVY